MKILRSPSLLLLLMLLALGCGSGEPAANQPQGASNTSGEPLTVGIVYDRGGLGDKSFNDSAGEGINRAKRDFNITDIALQSPTEKDYEVNLETLVDREADLIVAVGINMKSALEKVARANPNAKFAIVDAPVDLPNVRSLLFKEEEGSFLAGYLAGLMTETNKIGFVGGQEIPLIRKFQYGYEAGAKTANPEVQTLPAKFTGSWDDVGLGKEAARGLFASGADIVYHAAGRAGGGVIDAARLAGKYAIGVDSDQDYLAEGNVLTSMIKRVDQAIYSTIEDLRNGEFTPGMKLYDLKADGVGLSAMKFTRDRVGEDKIAKVEEMRQRIVDGSIQVPTTREEYDRYLSAARK